MRAAAPSVAGPPSVVVRDTRAEDARAIARVHVAAWRAGYRGILPDAALAELSVDRRAEEWRQRLGGRREIVVHVAERDGRLVGFCATGPPEEPDPPPDVAEIGALYVEPDVWGRGTGSALLAAAVARQREAGRHGLTLWVLEANERARHFYEARGWLADGARREAEGPLIEALRYRCRL